MKTVILGVSGGIAAYKSLELVSRLRKGGYDVRVIMTRNATEFVTPLSFETMSNNRVVVETFDPKREFEVEHVSYAKLSACFVVAPATANVIAKIAEGLADDMLSTTILATTAPKVICPAMNTNMYDNPAVQRNLQILRERGYHIVDAVSGMLACGDTGKGKMAEPKDIFDYIDNLLTPAGDYRGKHVLVTAGATREPIDGVRFISNRSSGKMGFAIARKAMERGARVTIVKAFTTAAPPEGARIVPVETTAEMYDAVLREMEDADVIVKAAAPADYRVKNYSAQKIKADRLTLELEKNPDIAAAVGLRKGERKLVVFAAETNDLLANAARKLRAKNADLMVANDVTQAGAGFDVDTNIATLIDASGAMTALEMMTKEELADAILSAVAAL